MLLQEPKLSAFARVMGRARLQVSPFLLRIDHPPGGAMKNPVGMVAGWFACREKNATPRLRIKDVDLNWFRMERSDIARLFGKEHCCGFRTVIDLNQVLAAQGGSGERLKLELVIGGDAVAQAELQVAETVIVDPGVANRNRARKREWLKTHVACPLCPAGTAAIDFIGDTMRCSLCGESFSSAESALNFLPSNFKDMFQIEDWDDISAHAYDEVASKIIEDARRSDGKVLDCGSGLRSSVDETVICLDVAAFPGIDVLGVNQRLPFQDAIFDAVLSLNVLEHVTDPFLCASELIRVLRPGGTLYCCIPFLQPEHGYPNHYFNATRSGLKLLFPPSVDLITHFVPGSGEPIWALQWFVSWYAKELPSNEREKFLDLRMRDLAGTLPSALLDESWVRRLSDEGRWQLACTTAAVFRKRADG